LRSDSVPQECSIRPLALSVIALVPLFTIAPRTAAGAPPDETPWEDVGVREGVHLYQRDVTALHAIEVRAVAETDAPAEDVFEVVADYGRYPEFMPGILEAKVMEEESGTREVYMRYKPQFLIIAARDVDLRVRLTPAPVAGLAPSRSEWENIEGRFPARPDTVRMPLNKGSWTIEPFDSNRRARLTYQVMVKPGGSIPDWLVRWGAASALPEVMHVVEARVKALHHL
jgi:hypothetical protein